MTVDTSHEFVALWPVLDPALPIGELLAQAEEDLPRLLTQAGAQIIAPGNWQLAPSDKVPGSGRVTDTVLLYRAPAQHAPLRPYRKATR